MKYCPECGRACPDNYTQCPSCYHTFRHMRPAAPVQHVHHEYHDYPHYERHAHMYVSPAPAAACPSVPFTPAAAYPSFALPGRATEKFGFGYACANFFRKSFCFSGRARRTEFWFSVLWFLIFDFSVDCLANIIGMPFNGEITRSAVALAPAALLVLLALLVYLVYLSIALLAVTVRRLHDTGKSGAYALFGLLPVAGWIVLLVFMCTDGDLGANRYGYSPK